MKEENKKYPEGQIVGKWMALGIAIFSGIGVPISIITKTYAFIGIGPAIGVGFGLSIGQGIENRYKKEGRIRPLTGSEKKQRKIATYIGSAFLIIGIIVFLLILFLK